MSKLIEQLKAEHVALLAILGKVKELGVGSKEGRESLLAAKASFLAHLKKEDAELYPTLRQAAETKPKLKQTLELFANDMDVVSRETLQFFEKYSQGGSSFDFATDFGTLSGILGARIRREETLIYEEYKDLQ